MRKLSETLPDRPLDKEKIRIGRAPDGDIILDGDMNVSRNHAEVLKGPAGWSVLDLGSFNGTFVNGERIKEKELRDGDKITIGEYTLSLRCEAVQRRPAPGAHPSSAWDGTLPAGSLPAAPAPASAAKDSSQGEEEFSTMILGPRESRPGPAAARAEPAPKPPAKPTVADAEDPFAITGILKAPVKSEAPAIRASADPDLEEGCIEIEIEALPVWEKNRVTKLAVGAAAACAIAGLAALFSADFRGLLLSAPRINFHVVPGDAQVYVNGRAMPRPGSGTLQNAPSGGLNVRVSHPDYPEDRTIELVAGFFKRSFEVKSDQAGISAK